MHLISIKLSILYDFNMYYSKRHSTRKFDILLADIFEFEKVNFSIKI